MDKELSIKLSQYIQKKFRSRYKTNREFADVCNVDEKTIRLIQQGKSNLTLKKFKQICDSQNVKMSSVLRAIGE